jgi:membrane associated rhomboid family serine protease
MAECYRHPGRETNVQCSNCGRPICPDCMTVTPVGMRCPECARDRTEVRRISPGLRAGVAPATYALIAINVVAFIAQVGGGGSVQSGGGSLFFDGALNGPAVADGEWYRIVTAGFLHAGIIHLAFNMFALYILGTLLEPGIGTPRFLAVYLVSLLAGSFGALLLSPDAFTVGASGAVFGLMSAAFIVARHRGVEQIAGQIGIFILINIFFTIGAASHISVGGHFGGLIGGALCALLIVFAERRARRPVGLEALGMAALGVISVAGALAVA